MISDKFANCARPEIQEDVMFRGQKVRVAKEWSGYTDQEKANAINYKFGCGIDIVVFMLELEREFEAIKAKLNNLPANGFATVQALGDATRTIEAKVAEVTEEVQKRVTPEYLAKLENSLFERVERLEEETKDELARRVTYAAMEDLGARVKAIETKPAEIEADAAAAALPAPYNEG